MSSALDISFASLADWSLILSLIFGGCCSNAWALELAARQNRNAGSLITLAQFLLVSVAGLPKHLCFVTKGKDKNQPTQYSPFRFRALTHQPTLLFRIRLKPRAIPISRWIVQVVLFLLTSLLNNAAFKYRVPMAIHIIFRSAGLVTNLLLGWAWAGKSYTRVQVLSVLIVTAGVVLTTVSAQPSSKPSATSVGEEGENIQYVIGIAILTGALVLSSAMGLAQDSTYAEYGRGHWEEGMFYLHFLALPMFLPLSSDIAQQVTVLNSSPSINLFPAQTHLLLGKYGAQNDIPSIRIPVFWIPLILNIMTQLVCVSGVHRLTAKVSSLTVTLVLAVRKAVSLVLSVVVLGKGGGNKWLWNGSLLVLAGTVLYTLDGAWTRSREPPAKTSTIKETKQE